MKFLAALALAPLALAAPTKDDKGEKGLHQLARKAGLQYFGSAIDNPSLRPAAAPAPYSIENPKYKKIAYDAKEFGQITPTNGLKWMFTEPQRGVFNYTLSEEVLKGTYKANQIRRCHALVWHNQLPSWLTSQTWSKEELLSILEVHIKNEVTRYRGLCAHWDVVNEAFNEDGTWRESLFYTTLGEEYIHAAFKFAAKYDPKAKLYYNDYNIETVGPKSAAALKLAKDIRKRGGKIDGMGLQSHLTVGGTPSYEAQKANIKQFADIGLDVAITELDIRLTLPDTEALTTQQAKDYYDTTLACKDTKGCVGITLWDFYDPFSWIPYAGGVFEGQGNPLPYREGFEKKPAHAAIAKALKGQKL